MMAEFPSLPLWTDAYLADTTHLSTEEHGAYLLLLIAAWRSPECRLPDDDAKLARFVHATPRVWARLRPVMAPFFVIEGGFWVQKRLSKERKYVADVSAKRSKAAHAKHLKNKETTHAHDGANGMHPHPHLESLPLDSQANAHSVPSERADEPPNAQPTVSAKAALWVEMKARIGGKRPGALVAKWCKDYGDGEVFTSHFEAEAKNPADYVPWMAARLKQRAAQRVDAPAKTRGSIIGAVQILQESGYLDDDREQAEPNARRADPFAGFLPDYRFN